MVVMVLSAHSDDAIIGMGGTMAKYASEGKRVMTVIYSSGDASPTWALDKKKLIRTRIKEAIEADRIIGASDTIFIGQKDAKLRNRQDFLIKKTVQLFKKYTPEKVFVHHANDMHPDHRAVWNACNQALKKSRIKTELYGYEVNSWVTPFVKENQIVVNITKFNKRKMRAIKKFKSQKYLLILLNPLVHVKAFYYGSIYGFKYAEQFYRY